ncbi:aminotransferase class III-fold pyridoxal phosphate-dependent enzyme [Acetomicrobium sp.]|uniref:aspartate aminotransferase family protein n=1 Tax=Acetomicrobium sp. TaxID=1872099 RepID=UPI001BCAEC72|nr:aminotransferase class III-fold pyridoxal phosphate-dependent enzyme [Acetomicrobium sp.]
MSELYGSRGITLTYGNGAIIRDKEGKEYIDFYCGSGAALFGHCHPYLVKTLKEASEMPWTVGIGMGSDTRNKFMESLKQIFPDRECFFCNSGSEAVEAALKLVTFLNSNRKKILALRRSFHGRTLGALSLTFNPLYRNPWTHVLLPVTHLEPEELPSTVDEDTVAVFVEPVRGEGGVYPLKKDIGKKITEACKLHEALLVSDEVQCGWGRCGDYSVSEQCGLDPDIICLAKGVSGGFPVGMMLWKEKLGGFPTSGHSSTYGGNPLAMALGLATISLLQGEGYMQKAVELGSYFRGLLQKIDSPLIREVRGRGLLNGVELSVKSIPLVKELQDRGVLALPAGPFVVRFLSPLTSTTEHFEKTADIFKAVLKEKEKGDVC